VMEAEIEFLKDNKVTGTHLMLRQIGGVTNARTDQATSVTVGHEDSHLTPQAPGSPFTRESSLKRRSGK
jgi:hypothetical protein